MPRLIRTVFLNHNTPDLKNALVYEWGVITFFWNHILPVEKEERAPLEMKRNHWKIIKELLIDFIGLLQQLQEPQDLSVQYLLYDVFPIEHVYAAVQRCWTLLQVEQQDIKNDNVNWGNVLHCLREINLQLWDIQYSNYIWLHDNRIPAVF